MNNAISHKLKEVTRQNKNGEKKGKKEKTKEKQQCK
jgi:hypothetical protein